ncbi:MAG: hypothetical protein LBQ99_03325 [Endomicrobium sp.]|jgi:glutamine synthetase|nr:hypothetical protein [Endomicrobium sp.]
MEDVDHELYRKGIPVKTRHNEVAPNQFELAPLHQEENLAIDNNLQIMEILKKVADKHNMVAILHEKPFAGVNDSGKHFNWPIGGIISTQIILNLLSLLLKIYHFS